MRLETSISESLYDHLKVGDELRVIYARSQPSTITVPTVRHARQLEQTGVQASTRVLFLDKHKRGATVGYELPGVGPIRHPISVELHDRLHVGNPILLSQLPGKPRIFRITAPSV
jgi:hypothetical protein